MRRGHGLGRSSRLRLLRGRSRSIAELDFGSEEFGDLLFEVFLLLPDSTEIVHRTSDFLGEQFLELLDVHWKKGREREKTPVSI